MKTKAFIAAFIIASCMSASAALTIITPTDVTHVGGGAPHQTALVNVINDSGLSSPLTHGEVVPSILPTHTGHPTYSSSMLRWLSPPTSITFDLGATWNLNDIIFYNYSENLGNTDRGLASVTAEISSDGISYTSVGTINFAEAADAATFSGEMFSFAYNNVSHVRFTNLVNHSGGSDNIHGFAEIRFTTPEPSSTALLGLGGLALALRRKRS